VKSKRRDRRDKAKLKKRMNKNYKGKERAHHASPRHNLYLCLHFFTGSNMILIPVMSKIPFSKCCFDFDNKTTILFCILKYFLEYFISLLLKYYLKVL